MKLYLQNLKSENKIVIISMSPKIRLMSIQIRDKIRGKIEDKIRHINKIVEVKKRMIRSPRDVLMSHQNVKRSTPMIGL